MIDPAAPVNLRIERIRRRYQTTVPYISVERARYYTESWAATAGQDLSAQLRVALAMKNVYEKMNHHVDADDRIAGCWTESFFGIPIDIERGVFNQVLQSELTKKSMLTHRARSFGKAMGYLIHKRALGDFVKSQLAARAAGEVPLDMGFKTMSEREINAYQIAPDDLRELKRDLLPRWKNKTLVDAIEQELVDSHLYSRDMHDFVVALPGNTSRQVMMLSTCATIASIQGHVILDYENVLKKGLTKMLDEVRARLGQTERLDGSQRDFLTSLEIALEGVMIFARRLSAEIDRRMRKEDNPATREILAHMLERCRRVPFESAGSFAEAIQSIWTIKTAVELAHPVNLHCFGRLDQILYPFYRSDIESGRIDEAQALELTEELLLKIMSQNIRPESGLLGNFYHRFLGSSPVTVGGLTPDGKDGTNELTSLFLLAAHRSKAITNMSVRISRSTPDDVLRDLAEYLGGGTSSYSLYNDEINIAAMRKRGFSEADARDYAIMGCVEATCPGKTGGMSANALLLTRMLDMTLRNGDSKTMAGTIYNDGLQTGRAQEFESFEELLEAFLRQGKHFIGKIVSASNIRDRVTAEHLPAPYISAFMDGCLESGKDVTRGGARYDLSGISMINSIANLVDSLYVIKKLVFEQKKFSLVELLRAVDNNFSDRRDILREVKKLAGKWGNGNPECDQLAARVTKALFEETYRYKSYKGGPFVVYVISMITHTLDGRLSIASPDGRRAARPFAASCNPANVERSGVTAALRSIAALPYEDVMGCAVNMKFHPTAIGNNRETRDKWASLIKTYFRLGGSQLQPTCVSAQTLRDARQNPDRYRDLIVKVGGYSTYFADLGREIQQEIIERTEHH
ncbi:MAG TPA: pyruvate formate lyase family protein [Myxococcota bacterium]|nr:pyruvate formate lyase family protein [Myxococcota bacterium]